MLSHSINVLSKRSSSSLLKKFIKTISTTNIAKMSGVKEGVLLGDVVKKLDEHAPLSIAESWDNVGLLLEPSSPHIVKHLFLTNDLTECVLDEALDKGVDMIMSYHPPIFASIKRITQNKWKDRLIVKCLENRVAIYSPHTSYDNVKGNLTLLFKSYSQILSISRAKDLWGKLLNKMNQ